MNPKKIVVSILFLKTAEGHWVAQCLEHDITSQGDTIEEVKKTFARTFAGQIILDIKQNKEPLQGIPPAPNRFRRLFEKGEPLKYPEDFQIPPPYQASANDVRVLG